MLATAQDRLRAIKLRLGLLLSEVEEAEDLLRELSEKLSAEKSEVSERRESPDARKQGFRRKFSVSDIFKNDSERRQNPNPQSISPEPQSHKSESQAGNSDDQSYRQGNRTEEKIQNNNVLSDFQEEQNQAQPGSRGFRIEFKEVKPENPKVQPEVQAESPRSQQVNSEVRNDVKTEKTEVRPEKEEVKSENPEARPKITDIHIGVSEAAEGAKKGEPSRDGRLVSDLRKAIGLNDRFRFRHYLFAGSDELMMQTIDELNAMDGYAEALEYLRKRFGWDEEDAEVQYFLDLLQRRFHR